MEQGPGARAAAVHRHSKRFASFASRAAQPVRTPIEGLWLFTLPLAPRSDEPELERRRKGDPQKIKIALYLRQDTTMTLAWVASRLKMGTNTHLAHLLSWQGREREKKK